MSTAAEQTPETLTERVEREMRELREHGALKKQLPTITRSTFERLSPQSQMDFMRAGGTLTDDPTPEKKPLPEGAIKRSTFDRMTPTVARDFFARGGFIVDDAEVAEEPPK